MHSFHLGKKNTYIFSIITVYKFFIFTSREAALIDNFGSNLLPLTLKSHIAGFKSYLRLERSLSENSIEAYLHDINMLDQFLNFHKLKLSPSTIALSHLQDFIKWVNELGLSGRSQARIISGIKGFFKYCLMENLIVDDPSQLLESPKLGRKLPDTLSIEDINNLINAIDLSKSEGVRNKAMFETLYSSGLRVTELINLKISNVHLDIGFLKVIGKGDKERLVPIGSVAIKHIKIYLEEIRPHITVQKGFEDNLFLNMRGRALSRVMIFLIIKQLAEKISLKKNISPHTFRHSFATHLIDGGADLRAVQEMLGHESITTTEIYTHLDRDYLRASIIKHHPRA
jgi:integrase/recombinase XerD